MTDDDLSYYQRRAEEERAAARRATNVGVARIHRQLAAKYAERANRASKTSPKRAGRDPASQDPQSLSEVRQIA